MCKTDQPPRSENELSKPLLQSQLDATLECPDESIAENASHNSGKRSRNIALTLAYTFVVFSGRAIWNQSVLSTFVYLLRDNNPQAVGFVTAVMGLCQLLASFPAGIFADKHGRDGALRIAVAIGLLAIGMTLTAVYKENYIILTSALAVWGLFWGIVNTSLTALFADSIEDGDRSKYFTHRSILIKLGNTTGPLVALIMFAVLGDKWTLRDCAVIVCVGQLLSLPAVLLLCFPSDKYALNQNVEEEDAGSDSLLFQEDSRSLDAGSSDVSSSSDSSLELLLTSPLQSDIDSSGHTEYLDSMIASSAYGCFPENRIIPIFVSLADVISGLASGMSIRYFPIFFLQNLSMSPVQVQVLFVVAPLMGTVLAHLGQLWSKQLGRCRVTCAFKWIGISSMVAMIVSYRQHLPVGVVCALYLIRTSFMNSTTALTKSILMDAVPKKDRGKWSALESVNMFSWSGSAALGGLLVGWEGIQFNFCITASLQLVATVPLVLLFKRDEMESEMVSRSSSASGFNSPSMQGTPSRQHFTTDHRFKV